jgi:long-chain fatty acid transport protein
MFPEKRMNEACRALFRFSLGASLLVMAAAPARAGQPAFSGLAASADTAETASSNPAGMTRLPEAAATARLLVAAGFGDFEVDESLTTTSGGNPDNEFSPVLVPLGYYVRPVGDRVHLGISLTVPSGFGADYGPSWAGRYYTQEYSLVYVALTPAISYRLNERWSVGAALGINYTSSESKVALNTLVPGLPDGQLTADLDGIGTNFSLSALWQLNDRLRFGLSYTSEANTDIDGRLRFRDPGPVLSALIERGVIPDRIEVRNTLPQRVLAGMYRELDSGGYLSLDLLWVEFSRFGTSAISLDGETINVEGGAYNNIWAGSIGYGFPAARGRRYRVGAFYIQQPVDDDKRTLALALDRVWGVGAGVELRRDNGRVVDLNLNLIDYGTGPVDTGPSLLRGRVVGETERPYAVMLEAAVHF